VEKKSLSIEKELRTIFGFYAAIGKLFVGIFLFIASLFGGSSMRSLSHTKERKELMQLHEEAKALYESSEFAKTGIDIFAYELVTDASEMAESEPSESLLSPFFDVTLDLMKSEGLWEPPKIDWDTPWGMEEEMIIRKYLRQQKRLFSREKYYLDIWRNKLLYIYAGIIGYIPPDFSKSSEGNGNQSFSIDLIDTLDNPAEVIERLLITFADDDVAQADLYTPLRQQQDSNILRASGIDPNGRYGTGKKIVLPIEMKGRSAQELIDLYLSGTPFVEFFRHEYTIALPSDVRFEHTHIVGGTGHGKTQLLQHLIKSDLNRAISGECGLCVIDSQGDLIRKLSRLQCFNPDIEGSLADKLLLIDPMDIEHPASLNMFDMHLDRVEKLPAVQREMILNGTIELYEYMFGALLGAELTQRQDVIFKYLARLLMAIPGATIQTLRELMEDSRPFQSYIDNLDGTTRIFFDTQFSSSSYVATKKQILTRLWGVLSNSTLERMFSNRKNKVDILEAMNSGRIVLINTAKDLLKTDGCHILGRFFIAQIAQAVLERAGQPEDKRLPFLVYIDEAQEYFDDHIETLLNQARKYRVGIHLAHQNLGQLSPRLKANLMSNTSTKLVGGVSSKDAGEFASDMNTEARIIQGAKKRRNHTEFALWVKNLTTQAVKISVPFGSIENEPTLLEEEYSRLIDKNRSLYSALPDERHVPVPQKKTERYAEKKDDIPSKVSIIKEPRKRDVVDVAKQDDTARGLEEKEEPIVNQEPARLQKPPVLKTQTLGRGGSQHQYLQGLVKKLAEERGFSAIIEENMLGGKGSVDVSLSKGERKLAVEISVTTTPEHELGNIRKCLAGGYDKVILLSHEKSHIRKVRAYVLEQLEEELSGRVQFLMPEEFITFLDQEIAEEAQTVSTVRGYKVKVNYTALNESEKQQRKEAIAKIILQSMKKMNK